MNRSHLDLHLKLSSNKHNSSIFNITSSIAHLAPVISKVIDCGVRPDAFSCGIDLGLRNIDRIIAKYVKGFKYYIQDDDVRWFLLGWKGRGAS